MVTTLNMCRKYIPVYAPLFAYHCPSSPAASHTGQVARYMLSWRQGAGGPQVQRRVGRIAVLELGGDGHCGIVGYKHTFV